MFNAESFSRSLGVSAPTVTRYLDFLEGGYLIRRLQPWFVNAKKRLVKSPKTYIRDTGILHGLLNIPSYEDLFGHPIIGSSWEGYVIEQIYQLKNQHTDLFFYRTQAGAECDLVLVKGITPMACIEIKLSNSPIISKGFINCTEDLEPKFKYVITPQSDTYKTTNDVVVTNLRNFLEEFLVLPKPTKHSDPSWFGFAVFEFKFIFCSNPQKTTTLLNKFKFRNLNLFLLGITFSVDFALLNLKNIYLSC